MTPFSEIISLATKKGERLTCAFPAAYFLDWIITFTQSIGWITDVAIQPEIEPTRNGLTIDIRRLSWGWDDAPVEDIYLL